MKTLVAGLIAALAALVALIMSCGDTTFSPVATSVEQETEIEEVMLSLPRMAAPTIEEVIEGGIAFTGGITAFHYKADVVVNNEPFEMEWQWHNLHTDDVEAKAYSGKFLGYNFVPFAGVLFTRDPTGVISVTSGAPLIKGVKYSFRLIKWKVDPPTTDRKKLVQSMGVVHEVLEYILVMKKDGILRIKIKI